MRLFPAVSGEHMRVGFLLVALFLWVGIAGAEPTPIVLTDSASFLPIGDRVVLIETVDGPDTYRLRVEVSNQTRVEEWVVSARHPLVDRVVARAWDPDTGETVAPPAHGSGAAHTTSGTLHPPQAANHL